MFGFPTERPKLKEAIFAAPGPVFWRITSRKLPAVFGSATTDWAANDRVACTGIADRNTPATNSRTPGRESRMIFFITPPKHFMDSYSLSAGGPAQRR